MEYSAGQQDTVVKIRTVLPDSGRLTGMGLAAAYIVYVKTFNRKHVDLYYTPGSFHQRSAMCSSDTYTVQI